MALEEHGVQLDQTLADEMVEQAVVYCARRKFNGNLEQTRLALRQGRCDACLYVFNSLVSQISEYLDNLDKTVKAVYEFEIEPSDLHSQTGGTVQREDTQVYPTDNSAIPSAARVVEGKRGLNLVAWVDRKSAALGSLSMTLETALAMSRRKLNCKNATPACFTLSIHMADDLDIVDQRGWGMAVPLPGSSANRQLPSTQWVGFHSHLVWTRPDPAQHYPPSALVRTEVDRSTPLDPELAPEELLIAQALAIKKIPPEERAPLEHHLRELKVVLIRRLISDQLATIHIAKEWFTIADLAEIHRRKIGLGKIGGKATGMLLAARILSQVGDEGLRACVRIPESFFIGSDVMYIFMAMNGLMHRNDQKYKSEEQIRAEYPQIQEEFQNGEFPPEVLIELHKVLHQVGPIPVIVRSSGQLEDNFGTSFAGKYDSFFCPNQGNPVDNLKALVNAIARTYASTLKPEALLYRRSRGLQDFDERMVILIQVVQGEQFGSYFLPHAAGVAFSHNLYRWAPQIRREDGFARLVWGLGTRAVERVGNDFPRLVALSHPTLQPDDNCEAIRHYSQHYVDLIDLADNQFKSLQINQVINSRYPPLRYIAQLEQDGYFVTPRSRVPETEVPRLAITFDELLRRTPFAAQLSRLLRLLEENYRSAVDVEFTVHIPDPGSLQPQVKISLLQCRPQSRMQTVPVGCLPKYLPDEDIVFVSHFIVPPGHLEDIQFVLYVVPDRYFALATPAERTEVGRIVARVNTALSNRPFICLGPGRWGTVNPDLGIYVSYSDICNAQALVELAGKGIGPAPEPSLGTHFFQDLMEVQIYPVAICLDDSRTVFNQSFFNDTPNHLMEWVECRDKFAEVVRLVAVADFHPGYRMELVMDDEKSLSTAFLATTISSN